MEFVKVKLLILSEGVVDELIETLVNEGYEGFEELEDGLLAYIPLSGFDTVKLEIIANSFGVKYFLENVPEQNWNALWESNFEPVIVDGFCTIKAGFHFIVSTTPYEIIITPKMSFGTGHHATTQLMMGLMKDLDFKGKNGMDFGCGTGVLAILAEKLGAAQVLAIDNDIWCVNNSLENLAANNCNNIVVSLNTIAETELVEHDFILANINRHIIIETLSDINCRLKPGAYLLLSGLLIEDEEILRTALSKFPFEVLILRRLNNWIAILVQKKP